MNSLPSPPAWTLLLGDVGRVCILLSSVLFTLCGATWFAAARLPQLARFGRVAFTLGALTLLGAFGSLAVLFANNRFEFKYIYEHSDHANALAYRIAGIWSGQEGSFLLWGACSAIFGLATVGRTASYRRWYTIVYSIFLGAITSILVFESPFNLNLLEGKPFVPVDGLGLAPSLQNYWVIIHPPTIFLGFGSLTCMFALAFAALTTRDFETWVPIVRPWALVSCSLVGVGLCMGGFWAYETLGWGGFWMWDPVENVSFVPWCFTAAFLHGLIVQVTKKKWQIANLLMGAMPFLVFVYGTFLTRSGFLSDASVHSFAEMDRSALKLLIGLMAVTFIGFLGLFGWRAFQVRKATSASGGGAPTLARDSFYMVGITLLITLGVATMIGMSVPLVQALRGEKPRVVEEAVYHQVLVWIFVPIMLIMAVAPLVAWRAMRLKDLGSRVYTMFCIAVGVTGTLLFFTVATPFGRKLELNPTVNMLGRFPTPGLAWLTFLVGICVFVVVSNIATAAAIFRRSKLGTASFLTHVGVALLMAGMVISRGFERKGQTLLMEGMPGRLLSYEIRYAGMTGDPMHRDNQLRISVYDAHKPGPPLFTATPGLYKIPQGDGQMNTMVWPHIERSFLMDTYVSLGQPQTDASQDVTVREGEKFRFGDMVLTYNRMTRKGQPGQLGTRFGADITVEQSGKSTQVNPEMELGGDQGMISHPAKIAENLQLNMLGMDAANRAVNLRVQLTTPIYPVEIYHKPMTSLVWLGTGLMTLGGLLSAFYRRASKARPTPSDPSDNPVKTEREPVLVGETL